MLALAALNQHAMLVRRQNLTQMEIAKSGWMMENVEK